MAEDNIQEETQDDMEESHSDCIIVFTKHHRVGVPQPPSYPTTEEKTAIRQQVKSRIKAMLDQDMPLFTMDAIRDIHRQIQKCMTQGGGKGEVFVKGLDGIMVRFQVEIGMTYEFLPGYISVYPVIEYVSMQRLQSDRWVEYLDPETAFCNLIICQRVRRIEKGTCEDRHAGQSKEQVEQIFRKHLHGWTSSEQCRKLQSLDVLQKDASKIKKIVAFACGSITRDDEPSEGRSSYQHGLIKTVHDMLVQARHDNKKNEQIQCFIQDPRYTEIDREILQDDYGIATILEDPEGFLQVDDSTLVMSFSPNVPVKQVVVDIAKPVVMIWNTVLDEDPNLDVTDPDSCRVRSLIDGFYDQAEFPEDTAHFSDIAIYRRRAC